MVDEEFSGVGVAGVFAVLLYIVILAVWAAALGFSIVVNRQEEKVSGAVSRSHPI